MNFKTYLKNNSWENNLDYDVPEKIIKKLNDIKWLNIVSSCSGHEKEGPSLFFEIEKEYFSEMLFSEIKKFYDAFITDIENTVSGSSVKWICWINPNEFLYDSDYGYNKDIIKKYSIKIKDAIYHKIFIEVIKEVSDKENNEWWQNLYKYLNNINILSLNEETTREILNKNKFKSKNKTRLKNYLSLLDLDKFIMTLIFIKIDGTRRVMRCTRNLNHIPTKDHPKGTGAPKRGVLSVYDLDKQEWRSFRLNNLRKIVRK